MSSLRADSEKATTAHSVLSSFQYSLRPFPSDALHRFTALSGIGRLTETVTHLTGSPLPLGMGLHTGLTVYFKDEIESFVYFFLQRSTICTFS